MNFSISDLISPHYCCSCGRVGKILCGSCFYDIVSDNQLTGVCLDCMKYRGVDGACKDCKPPFSRAWLVGKRQDALKKLTNLSKYEACRSGCLTQAQILDEVVPVLPKNVVVVPIPTIYKHIRQRGFDHCQLIAKNFAKMRGLDFSPALGRVGDSVQQGASVRLRQKQADQAYEVSRDVDGVVVLLVDDVYTTGATIKSAAKLLLQAGASDVWVAVTARQTF